MTDTGPSELPPGATTATDTESYIGIPDDYLTQRTRYVRRTGVAMDRGTRAPVVAEGPVRSPIGQAPSVPSNPAMAERRYKSGEERTLVAGLSPERIAQLQRQLVNAGLLTGRVVLGVWDDSSATAFRQVLAIANVNGYTADEALQYVATQSALPENILGDSTDTRAPLSVQLSSPADLARIFQQTAEATMGRRLDQADIDKLVGSYQSLEQGYQQTTYGQAETGGTLTAPPSATAFAESELEQTNPGEVGAAAIADTFDNFLSILGGAGG